MRLFVILGVIGRLLRLFSAAFVLPIALAIYDQITKHPEASSDSWVHFSIAMVVTFVVGSLASYAATKVPVLYRSEALGAVAGTWLVVAAFAAVPYVLEGLSVVDALFESMSGLTTTGATILTETSFLQSRAFFLWRAMTQWFGGLGVIALFIVILPQLGIAGRQLFFAEASEVSEAISPQIQQTARRLWLLYAMLTLFLTALLFASGFDWFTAFVHALTTLSAGGFSPSSTSIQGYGNPVAEWVLFVFMILAGTSFTLQWKAFTSRPSALIKDGEFRFYFGACVVGALALSISVTDGLPTWDSLRDGAFQSASLISSTGFASVNYDKWNDASRAILVAIMLVNGCAGSASGGAKAIRHLLVVKFLRREITQVLHPYGVLPLRYGPRAVPDTIMRAVFTLVLLYLVGYVLIGITVVAIDDKLNLVDGFSASLACLGNIGPGFGVVGPMESFADLSSGTKLVLTFAMWIGRLEIVTVLALFHPHVWKRLQLTGRR